MIQQIPFGGGPPDRKTFLKDKAKRDFTDRLKKDANDIKSALKRKTDTAKRKNESEAFQETLETGKTASGKTYAYDTSKTQENWYAAMPYGFQFFSRDKKKSERAETIYLPISPSNLNITTHYATNVITTLYGTVEEHSEQRYFDIVIEGTTGVSPRYVQLRDVEYAGGFGGKFQRGRLTANIESTIPSLGGFFSKTIGRLNTIAKKANDILGGENNATGIDINRTGYVAFHNLYKFFLQYKRDAAGLDSRRGRRQHPLWFVNYKDNNRYKCSIQRFVLKRQAADPMLYNYSIILRAYEIQNVSDKVVNVFASRIRDLGLNGVKDSSIFSTIKNVSNGAKGIVGSLVGGINLLGR